MIFAIDPRPSLQFGLWTFVKPEAPACFLLCFADRLSVPATY